MKRFFSCILVVFIFTTISVAIGNANTTEITTQVYQFDNIDELLETSSVNTYDSVFFDLTKARISKGYIDIPIYIKSNDSIFSLDFSLKFNHAVISYTAIENLIPSMQIVSNYNTNDSMVRFTSNSFTKYSNFKLLANIRFKMLTDKVCYSDIQLMHQYLNGELASGKIFGCAVMMLDIQGVNPTCSATYDGSLNLTVYGGSSPFTYKWSTMDTSKDVSNVKAGKYKITVTDSKGFTKTDSVELMNPSLNFKANHPICTGYKNGSITVSVIHAKIPYYYQWSSGKHNKDINLTNIGAGLYTVTVTDSNNCVIVGQQQIYDTVGMHFSYIVKSPTCPTNKDGSIELSVKGGVLPYSFKWSTNDTVKKINSLAANTYKLSVTDMQGCVLIDSVVVNDPTGIMALFKTTNLSCYGVDDGAIKLFVSGGTTPYFYKWSTSKTTKDIDDLSSGMYIVTITDNSKCKLIDSVKIDNELDLLIRFNVSNPTCFELNNGMIHLNSEGGKLPFTYNWSNGKTDPSIYNLSAGVYTVTVTQTNTCVKIDSIRLSTVSPIRISFSTTNPTCSANSDGSVLAIIKGGTEPYSFKWSNTNFSNQITHVAPGNFIVTVTDAHTCVSIDTVTLVQTGQSCIEIYNAFSPNADGINDVWHIKNIDFYPTCIVRIFNEWGSIVYSSTGYNIPWDGNYKGEALPTAAYYYFIELGNDETFSGYVSIIK